MAEKREGDRMDKAWMEFTATGKVEDYLRYKNSTAKQGAPDRREKERPDGTEYRSDRNGLTGNADWRV